MTIRSSLLSGTGLLLALSVTSNAFALKEEQTDQQPGGAGPSSSTFRPCTDYYPYVEGQPPQLPSPQVAGKVYCVSGGPSTGFGSQADFYPFETDVIGANAEAASAAYCHAPGVTTCVPVAAGPRGFPPARQVCTTTTPPAPTPQAWEAGWRKSKVVGNDKFGAGAYLTAVLGATPGTPAVVGPDNVMIPEVGDKLHAEASLRLPVTVFGQSTNAVHLLAEADAEYGKEASVHTVVILAAIILHEETSTQALQVTRTWQRDLLSAQKTFFFGPVPATVQAKLRGTLGFHAEIGPKVTAVGTGIGAEAEPSLNVNGTASLAVGAAGLQAGIEGQLELLDVSVPSNGALLMDPTGKLSWNLDSDLELRTMSGQLSAFLEIFNKRWRHTLVSFQGYNSTIPLFHRGNCSAVLHP